MYHNNNYISIRKIQFKLDYIYIFSSFSRINLKFLIKTILKRFEMDKSSVKSQMKKREFWRIANKIKDIIFVIYYFNISIFKNLS